MSSAGLLTRQQIKAFNLRRVNSGIGGSTGGSQGIYSYSNWEVSILRSKITANGGGSNEGVVNHGGKSFIEHSTIKASTSTVVNNLYQVFQLAGTVRSCAQWRNWAIFSAITMDNGRVSASSSSRCRVDSSSWSDWLL